MNVTIMLEIRKSLQTLPNDHQRMQFLHNIGQWVNQEMNKLNEKLTTIFLEIIEDAPIELSGGENSTIWDSGNQILDYTDNEINLQENEQSNVKITDGQTDEILSENSNVETDGVSDEIQEIENSTISISEDSKICSTVDNNDPEIGNECPTDNGIEQGNEIDAEISEMEILEKDVDIYETTCNNDPTLTNEEK